MGVGSGWAGPLMFLLLLLASRASPTTTPARRPRLLNLSRVARPFASPVAPHAPPARGQVQYTLDLLASPASREGVDEHEDAKLASQLTVEAQLLPWAVGVGAGGGMGCLETSVAARAAHLALQHHPPPAGVALLVLPPPPGECSFCSSLFFLVRVARCPLRQETTAVLSCAGLRWRNFGCLGRCPLEGQTHSRARCRIVGKAREHAVVLPHLIKYVEPPLRLPGVS